MGSLHTCGARCGTNEGPCVALEAAETTMRVKSLIDHPPVTVGPDATVLAVTTMMREDDIGAVLVLDRNRLVGIVTDRDIATKLTPFGAPALAQPIARFMTLDPLTCSPDQDVRDATVLMADFQVRRLPVLDASGRVVGLLTLDMIAEDFCEHLAGETLGEIVEQRSRKPLRVKPEDLRAGFPVPKFRQ